MLENIPGVKTETPIAGFWKRVLAMMLDSFFLGIVGMVLGIFLFNQFARPMKERSFS